MTGHTERPLLFLDVDGPLLPFGEDPQGPARVTAPDSPLARLTAGIGRQLAALPCELVWATTWEDEANAVIAPRIGLPRLPVVSWPEPTPQHEREDQWFGLCWKTRTLVNWASGRPFAWVDDEITDADREWVSAHHNGRALLHHVEPYRGLAIGALRPPMLIATEDWALV
ncbi:HAD domain-containing protein [Sphaerisporangium corydalis]|uniref:HAD domain-containing protein n=1 Tax=Sphaerisporangium corydalis TaxID=1441875 RepID=A0ABV9EC65_9ACTN|nr:HAD domain-containing protein [Sphaerisporangium corydalis]